MTLILYLHFVRPFSCLLRMVGEMFHVNVLPEKSENMFHVNVLPEKSENTW